MSIFDFKDNGAAPANPPAGYIRLYPEGNVLKYKDPSGTIYTLATGVSPEEVQDIVGAFFTDSSTINVTYNDAGDVISADVIPGAVNHDALLNFVANKHVDHSLVSVNAGTGLTGGGDLTASRTISMPNTGTAGTYRSVTTDAQGRVTAGTNPTTLAGYGITDAQPLDGDLTAVAALAGAGFAVRTTTNAWATRSIVAGTGIGVTNSDGVFGSPTISNTDLGSTAVSAHVGLSDPHTQYVLETTTVTAGSGLTGGGSLATNITISMPAVGTAGTYGSATSVPVFVTDTQGRISSVTPTTIAIPSTQITDFSEAVQDVVGAAIVDSASIDFTYNDVANTQTASVIPGGVNHNALANLATGDVHTQYSLLAGRAGGQSLTGGTASGDNLTLSSTSNATKGKIFLGSNTVFDEVNSRLGIGLTSPSNAIDVQGTGAIVSKIRSNTNTQTAFYDASNDSGNYLEMGIFGSTNASGILGDSTAGKSFIITSATAPLVISHFGAQRIIIGNSNTERLSIDTSGNVLIGTPGSGGQAVMGTWSTGTAFWLNMPTTGPSGIGSGGAGVNPWIAYASGPGQWFTDSLTADICYRNQEGRLIFGNTSGNSIFRIESSTVTAGVSGGASLTNNPFSANIDANSYGQMNVQNLNAGASASSDIVATANNGTDTTNFINMGVNSSGWSDPTSTINGPNDGYLYVNGGDLSIGTATSNKIVFFTGDTLAENERARITPTGQFAVGSTAPNAAAKVQIDSTTQGFLMPRMTYAQAAAIATPPAGLQVYVTGLNTIVTFDGSQWLFDLWQVVQNNQTNTTVTYADVTNLVTPTLPAGRYAFQFVGTCQSTATTTGVGVRLAPASTGGATIGALIANWTISQAANGTAKNFDYSQLSVTDNITSASVLTANADFPVIGHGVFSISVAGAVAIQIRSEIAASGISVRINSSLNIRRITG